MKHQIHDRNLDLLMDISVPVQISFGRIRMPLDDLLQLKAGGTVELDQEVDGDVEVVVNNRVIARGEIVEFEGGYGVRIRSVENGITTPPTSINTQAEERN